MKRLTDAVALVGAAVLALAGSVAADGHARVVIPLDLDAGEVAEGVAVDSQGNVYAGISSQGRMLRWDRETEMVEDWSIVAGLQPGDFGLVGHAMTPDGWLHTAVSSTDPELNGVVGFVAGEHDPLHAHGSEAMVMPNGIAFGEDDPPTMYVSDTIMGAVWKLPFNGFTWYAEPELWLADPLLLGTDELPMPFPVGANGIDVVGDTVYVAVTEQSSIVAIPIEDDGSAGTPEVFLQLPGVGPDGIAFDDAGNLYVADPAAHTLWKVGPGGAPVAVADVDDGLAGPSSVALWDDPDGGLFAYISNQAVGPEGTVEHGPSIIEVALE